MEWTRVLIQRWKEGGTLSRGEFYWILERMDIIIDESMYLALIEEFDREEDLSSKWGLSTLIMNRHLPAEQFYHDYCEIKDITLSDEEVERIKPVSVAYFNKYFDD